MCDRGYLAGDMRTFAAIIFWSTVVIPASGQARLFGSRDDLLEQPNRVAWLYEGSVGIYTGLSLIGPQWRTAGRVLADARTPRISARFSGTLRAGLYGAYEEDVDELYDLLRAVEYVHYESRSNQAYIRLGALNRTRLGLGQVVNFLNSTASWAERGVGIEAEVSGPALGLQVFATDVRLDGLVGAQIQLRPFAPSRYRALRSFQLSAGRVWDRHEVSEDVVQFGALTLEARFEAWRSGAFGLLPFVSYSRSRGRGDGLFAGADVQSDNFIDLARLHFRVALHFNSRRFLPGYAGPFYMVQSPHARIIAAEQPDEATTLYSAGTSIDAVPRNQGLETELRILIFDRFEFWYRFVRNFASSSLSQFNTRLAVRARNFRLAIGQDRGSLAGIFSLFDSLGDINLLRFEAAYRFQDFLWVQIEARYTYERLPAEGVEDQFQIERRFDPLVGLRYSF